VASGLVPIALGTDTAGSIRIPASLCGVVGLKGTYGRVSTDGVVPLSWSMDHCGPLAASVEDARIAFGILAGAPLPAEPLAKRPRIGICDEWWRLADPEVARVSRAALDQIGDAVAIELPHIGLSVPAGSLILLVEAAAANRKLLDEDAPLQPSVRAQLEVGLAFRASELLKAQQVRTLLAQEFAHAFETVDLIATPSTAITAPPYQKDAFAAGETDQRKIDQLICFTTALNLAGLPAISVPCGLARGLPVGLQLVGPPRAEPRVIAAAALVEQCVEIPNPPGWLDLLA
jgi:aspartyl-tRNA(Asn)/glutamyl-tRNA(Gln) amidotransferase subunit A